MHLLYLDDSGSANNPNEQYLVLGGVAVFEEQVRSIIEKMDRLAEGIDAQNPHGVEFHASEIFSRRVPPWDRMSKEEAQGVIVAVLRILAESRDTVKAFACAIHKKSYTVRDPMALAFEDLCTRFDAYLSRLLASGDRQKGLLILDESTHETTLQNLARNFRRSGTRWRSGIRNIADTPLFVNSRASRIVQLADHVAYAVFRRYDAKDTRYFDVIAGKFDAAEGKIHGLAHKQGFDPNCLCPACLSRKMGRKEG